MRMCSTSRKRTFRQATMSATAGDEADEEDGERQREPDGRARAGDEDSESTIRIASITAKVTAWVATTEKATSWRGKRTFLISSALSTIERDARLERDARRRVQQAIPASR